MYCRQNSELVVSNSSQMFFCHVILLPKWLGRNSRRREGQLRFPTLLSCLDVETEPHLCSLLVSPLWFLSKVYAERVTLLSLQSEVKYCSASPPALLFLSLTV